jgi:hypothetical protein
MGDDLLLVSRAGSEALKRSLVDAIMTAVQPAIHSLVTATVEAHVRAFVDGAAMLPQPTFNPPAVPVPVAIVPASELDHGNGTEAPAPLVPPLPSTTTPVTTAPTPTASGAGDGQVVGRRYKMGKGAKHKFSDIAWTEIPQDDWFDLNDAWLQVEPLIEYDSERAPENFRRAIRQDTERFEVSADMRRARKKKAASTQEVLIGTGL